MKYDASYAEGYRASDDEASRSPEFAEYRRRLGELCRRFGRPISVLDVGCGTGRYFHCLEAVERLVGVDVSPAMLEQARRPLAPDGRLPPRIELVGGDFMRLSGLERSFDLAFSIGVLGNVHRFDASVAARLQGFLRPGGIAFFTVVESGSVRVPDSRKRRAANALSGWLPGALRERLERRWQGFASSRAEVEAALGAAAFEAWDIERRQSQDPGWDGAQFWCVAPRRLR